VKRRRSVSNGRDGGGRFTRGNRHGRGNPNLRALGDAQAAIRAAFSGEDVVKVLRALLRRAERGDVAAAVAFLGRVAGPIGRRFVDADLASAKTPAEVRRAVTKAAGSGTVDLEAVHALAPLMAPRPVDELDGGEAERVPDETFL
jgi:hypothetical protein